MSPDLDPVKQISSSSTSTGAPVDALTDATILKPTSGAIDGDLGVKLSKPVETAGAAVVIDRVPGVTPESASPAGGGSDAAAPPTPGFPSSASGDGSPAAATPFDVDAPPPPPPAAPARGGLLSKGWMVAVAAALAFAVAAVASGAAWSLAAGPGSTGGPDGLPLGTDGKPVRTAMPVEQVQEQVEDADLEGSTSAPSAAGGAAAGGKPAVTQPSRDAVMQNLLSAPVPEDCLGQAGTLSDGVMFSLPNVSSNGFIKLRWLDTPPNPYSGKYAKSTSGDDVAWGDVTGDDVDDIAVRMTCWPGGVYWPDLVVVYEVASDGSLSILGARFPSDLDGVQSQIGNGQGTFTDPPRFENASFTISGGIDTNPRHTNVEARPDTKVSASFSAADGSTFTQAGSTTSIKCKDATCP